mmetsp:Transcript_10902/g.40798  ORF Transcript_10902/g.40798 Transcript_10902/m.40798 type:complete len:218 (+) Transcript_10902:195-848(+)
MSKLQHRRMKRARKVPSGTSTGCILSSMNFWRASGVRAPTGSGPRSGAGLGNKAAAICSRHAWSWCASFWRTCRRGPMARSSMSSSVRRLVICTSSSASKSIEVSCSARKATKLSGMNSSRCTRCIFRSTTSMKELGSAMISHVKMPSSVIIGLSSSRSDPMAPLETAKFCSRKSSFSISATSLTRSAPLGNGGCWLRTRNAARTMKSSCGLEDTSS